EPILTVPWSLAGSQPFKAKGFTIDAFKLPEKWLSERLKGGKSTPVLTLTRTGKAADGVPEKLNLFLSEKEATLVPTMQAPTENRGFGAIPQPPKEWILDGTATWGQAAKPAD